MLWHKVRAVAIVMQHKREYPKGFLWPFPEPMRVVMANRESSGSAGDCVVLPEVGYPKWPCHISSCLRLFAFVQVLPYWQLEDVAAVEML